MDEVVAVHQKGIFENLPSFCSFYSPTRDMSSARKRNVVFNWADLAGEHDVVQLRVRTGYVIFSISSDKADKPKPENLKVSLPFENKPSSKPNHIRLDAFETREDLFPDYSVPQELMDEVQVKWRALWADTQPDGDTGRYCSYVIREKDKADRGGLAILLLKIGYLRVLATYDEDQGKRVFGAIFTVHKTSVFFNPNTPSKQKGGQHQGKASEEELRSAHAILF